MSGHFTGTDRISDFSLSDYWGADNTCASEYNLENEISVMVVNTDKARGLLSHMSKDFIYGPIDPMERAVPCNLAFTRPQTKNENRTRFFAEYYDTDYDSLIRKIFRPLLFKQNVKKLLGPKGVAMIKKIKKSGGIENFASPTDYLLQPSPLMRGTFVLGRLRYEY